MIPKSAKENSNDQLRELNNAITQKLNRANEMIRKCEKCNGFTKEKSFNLEQGIEELLYDMRKGFSTSTISILQTEVDGKRVEIQLYATDNEDDFCL